MDFIVKINLDDDDLRKHPESGTIEILGDIVTKIEAGRVSGGIADINGNRVGKWEFTDD